jgi:hypothetical protein
MTKKQTEHVSLDEALTQVPVEDMTIDRWARSDVLEKAITFHKNNGGMHQPNQVVATAQVFLDFISGESK